MSISPSDILLTDRVAVVTGGGAGIGGLGIVTDVRDTEQVSAALDRTVSVLGPVRILVNNAGGVLLQTRRHQRERLGRPL